MELFGFEKIKKSLLDNFNHNQLHHGLLFSGNKGVGKASFAFNLASEILLSSSSCKSDDLQKIKSGSHPDLLIIQKDEKKRDITIDAVREIAQFLSLTSAIAQHRIIIIDAVDNLNKNSANAILKILEEPPTNVFLFLINHNPGKLLDTIKSRCQPIKIASPNYNNFKTALQKNIASIDEGEIKILSKICDNSIGSAIQMHKYDVINLQQQINQLILGSNHKEIFSLAKKISGENELWEIFEKLIIFYLYNLICHSSCNSHAGRNGNEEKIFILIDKITNLFSVTKNLNLDKNQTIINIFNIIKNVEN